MTSRSREPHASTRRLPRAILQSHREAKVMAGAPTAEAVHFLVHRRGGVRACLAADEAWSPSLPLMSASLSSSKASEIRGVEGCCLRCAGSAHAAEAARAEFAAFCVGAAA
jgi:hypothetical protein